MRSFVTLCFFNVSNRYTFDPIFKCDGESKKVYDACKASVVEMVVRFVRG